MVNSQSVKQITKSNMQSNPTHMLKNLNKKTASDSTLTFPERFPTPIPILVESELSQAP